MTDINSTRESVTGVVGILNAADARINPATEDSLTQVAQAAFPSLLSGNLMLMGATSSITGDRWDLRVEETNGGLWTHVRESALPTGASTEAKQDTIIGHVNGIEGLQNTTNSTLAGIADNQTNGNQLTQVTDTVGAAITYQAAGADGVSNTANRVPVVAAGQTFNGTTWDRQQSVVAGLNSTGTGLAAAGIVAQVDDTATSAVTENNFGPVRMSTRRALLVEGVASGTAAPVNLTLLRGNNISAGAGVNGTGTLRVTMATDQAAMAVKSVLKDLAANAYTPNDYVSDSGNSSYQLTPFVINAAAAGANTIVAAVAAKTHYVLSYGFCVDAAVTMTWTDGTANLSGAMLLAPGIWYHMEGDKTLFKTAAVNRPISMTLSAAVQVSGHGVVVSY